MIILTNDNLLELLNKLEQWFLTFFGLLHPYLVLKIFGATPGRYIRYKIKVL